MPLCKSNLTIRATAATALAGALCISGVHASQPSLEENRSMVLNPYAIDGPGTAETITIWGCELTMDELIQIQRLESFKRLSGPTNQQQQLLGPLFDLLGSWSGSKGWNLVAMPSAGSKPADEGDFILLVQPYYEEIKFTPVGGAVRNRGGDEDQFIGGVQYELFVSNLDTDEALHVENGMWLFLPKVVADPGPGAGTPPPHAIARSSTIPHGDSVLLLGDHFESKGPPPFGAGVPAASAMPFNVGSPPLGYTDPYMEKGAEFGLDMTDFNLRLKKDLEGQNVTSTSTIVVDSKNGGGLLNIPFIVNRADATRFQTTFWIETVKDDSGLSFLQLQYTQITDLGFHHPFGGGDGLIVWPHLNINTVRKQ